MTLSYSSFKALSDEYEKWGEVYEPDRTIDDEFAKAFDSLFETVGMVLSNGICELDDDDLNADLILEKQEMEDFADDNDFSDYDLNDY